MPRIHVCSLAKVSDTVSACGASHLITLLNEGTPIVRPAAIPAERHLFLALNDIIEPMDGLTMPGEEHLRMLVDFARGWDRRKPIVIHCFAGISRSTAAAYVLACALAPERDERDIALELRRASRIATPNRLIVALGDELLARDGRMIDAVEAIGRGSEAVEGEPFSISLGD